MWRIWRVWVEVMLAVAACDGLLRVCLDPPIPNNLSCSVLTGSAPSSPDLGTIPVDRGLVCVFNKSPRIHPSLGCRTLFFDFISGDDLAVLHIRSLEDFSGLAWSRGMGLHPQFLASVLSPVGDVFSSFCCVDRGPISASGLVLFVPSPPSTSCLEARCAVLRSGGVGASLWVLQESLYGDLQPRKRFSSAAGACAQPSSMAPADSVSSVPLGGLSRGTLVGVPSADLVATEVVSRRGDRLRSAAVLVMGHVARPEVHVWLRVGSSSTRVGRYPVFIHVYSSMAVIFIFLVASGCNLLYYFVGFIPTSLGI